MAWGCRKVGWIILCWLGCITIIPAARAGTVVAWGARGSLALDLPDGLVDVVDISVGHSHALALRADGEVVAWGGDHFGQIAVPEDLEPALAVAAGLNHSLALLRDGSVRAWGSNGDRQASPPGFLRDVVAIAAGNSHSLALRSNGSVVGWGKRDGGLSPIPLEAAWDVVAIDAGWAHSVALKNTGELIIWGEGLPSGERLAELGRVEKISAGYGFTAVLDDRGRTEFLTSDYAQRMGRFWDGADLVPGQFVDLFAGPGFLLGLTPPGSLEVIGPVSLHYVPPPGLNAVTKVATSGRVTLALVEAKEVPVLVGLPEEDLVGVGHDLVHEVAAFGNGPLEFQWSFDGVEIEDATGPRLELTDIRLADSGTYSVAVRDAEGGVAEQSMDLEVVPRPSDDRRVGTIVVWGRTAPNQREPAIYGDYPDVIEISAAGNGLAALGASGEVRYLEPAGYRRIEWSAETPIDHISLRESKISGVDANGLGFELLFNSKSRLYSPHRRLFGMVDVARTESQAVWLHASGRIIDRPVNNNLAGRLRGVIDLKAGASHVLALLEDGSVAGWGDNSLGQLEWPMGLDRASQIAAGLNHSLAIRPDGSVVAWGDNEHGQSSVPKGLGDVVAIGAGSSHSLAVRNDGSVVAWGLNAAGQTSVPKGLNQVIKVAAGYNFSAALVEAGRPVILYRDKTLAVIEGQLFRVPIQVVGNGPFHYQWRIDGEILPGEETRFLEIPAALSHDDKVLEVSVEDSAGVLSTETFHLRVMPDSRIPPMPGTVVELDGDAAFVPDRLGKAEGIVAISSGERFGGLKEDGSVVVWGHPSGQMAVPEGLENVVDLAFGRPVQFALKKDGTLSSWRDGNSPVNPELGHDFLKNGFGIVDIEGDGGHFIALRADGTIDEYPGWGRSWEGLENVVAVAASRTHSMALLADGELRIWGDNEFGQAEVPVDLGPVKAIGASESISWALTGDGVLHGWGDMERGRFSHYQRLPGVESFFSGHSHVIALLTDGSISAWGFRTYLRDWFETRLSRSEIGGDIQSVRGGRTELSIIMETMNPVILDVPERVAVAVGHRLRLAARPFASVPFTAGWFAGEEMISEEGALELNLESVDFGHSGTYSFRVEDERGRVTERSVLVEVYPKPPPKPSPTPGRLFAWGASGVGPVDVPPQLPDVARVFADEGRTVLLGTDGVEVQIGFQGRSPFDLPEGAIERTGGGVLFEDGTFYGGGSSRPRNLVGVISGDSGHEFTVVATADGAVRAWGLNDVGQTSVPGVLDSVVKVSCGLEHTIALRSNGTVVAWGGNTYRQIDVPPGLNDVVDIAAGGTHSLVLRGDGTLVSWGNNEQGQTDIPANLAQAVAIAAGRDHSAAIVDLGVPLLIEPPHDTIAYLGQGASFHITALGRGSLSYQWLREGVPIEGEDSPSLILRDLTRESAGNFTVLVRDEDGDMALGEANLAIVDRPPTRRRVGKVVVTDGGPFADVSHLEPITQRSVVDIGGHSGRGVALSDSGEVLVWDIDSVLVGPHLVEGLGEVEAVSQFGEMFTVLRRDGSVFQGRLSRSGEILESSVPPLLQSVVAIDSGYDHTLALNLDGTVDAWGNNSRGQTDVPRGLGRVVAIDASAYYSLALNSEGRLVGWGANDHGQLDIPDFEHPVVGVSAGPGFGLALLANGELIGWGKNDFGQIDVPADLINPTYFEGLSNWSLAIDGAGKSYSWGRVPVRGLRFPRGLHGIVKKSNNLVLVDREKPVVFDLPEETIVAAGQRAALAARVAADGPIQFQWSKDGELLPGRDSDYLNLGLVSRDDAGTYTLTATDRTGAVGSLASRLEVLPAQPERVPGVVVAWGDNSLGQTTVPDNLQGIVELVAGRDHTVALRADGTVVMWGGGRGMEAIGPEYLSGVVSIAAQDNLSFALKLDGSIVGWDHENERWDYWWPPIEGFGRFTGFSGSMIHAVGWDDTGRFASWDRSRSRVDLPDGLQQVVKVTSSQRHFLALRADGTVVGWGSDFRGSTNVPVALTDVVDIAAGDGYSLALRSNGEVVGWGLDDYGLDSLPEGVGLVDRIFAGPSDSAAILRDGSLVVWGRDDGSHIGFPRDLRNVATVAIGRRHMAALVTQREPVIFGVKPDQSVTEGGDLILDFGVAGHTSLSFQWFLNGTPIPGATQPSLTVDSFGETDAGEYVLMVGDEEGNVGEGRVNVNLIPNQPEEPRVGALMMLNSWDGVTYPFGMNDLTAIAVGLKHIVAVREGGTVVAWGDDDEDQVQVPDGLVGIQSVAAGDSHSLALRDDGTVIAWGANDMGQSDVPLGLNEVVEVGAGSDLSAALRRDGTVVIWGESFSDRMPEGFFNVVEIDVGTSHILARRFDGGVVEWGRYTDVDRFTRSIENALSVGVGDRMAAVLLPDHSVEVWGPSTQLFNRIVRPIVNTTLQISVGGDHLVLLQENGRILIYDSERRTTEFQHPLVRVGGSVIAMSSYGNSTAVLFEPDRMERPRQLVLGIEEAGAGYRLVVRAADGRFLSRYDLVGAAIEKSDRIGDEESWQRVFVPPDLVMDRPISVELPVEGRSGYFRIFYR